MKAVGAGLRAARKRKDLSQDDVAIKVGFAKSTISRAENGKQMELSAAVFFVLCEFYGIDPINTWYGDVAPSARKTKGASMIPPPPASTPRPMKIR